MSAVPPLRGRWQFPRIGRHRDARWRANRCAPRLLMLRATSYRRRTLRSRSPRPTRSVQCYRGGCARRRRCHSRADGEHRRRSRALKRAGRAKARRVSARRAIVSSSTACRRERGWSGSARWILRSIASDRRRPRAALRVSMCWRARRREEGRRRCLFPEHTHRRAARRWHGRTRCRARSLLRWLPHRQAIRRRRGRR